MFTYFFHDPYMVHVFWSGLKKLGTTLHLFGARAILLAKELGRFVGQSLQCSDETGSNEGAAAKPLVLGKPTGTWEWSLVNDVNVSTPQARCSVVSFLAPRCLTCQPLMVVPPAMSTNLAFANCDTTLCFSNYRHGYWMVLIHRHIMKQHIFITTYYL